MGLENLLPTPLFFDCSFASQGVAGLSGSGVAKAAGNQDLLWYILTLFPLNLYCPSTGMVISLAHEVF